MDLPTFLERLRLLPEGIKEDVFDVLNTFCDGEGDEKSTVTELLVLLSQIPLKRAVCIDNSGTWRNVLTIKKEYLVIEDYIDSYGVRIFKVKCDDGTTRPYRADRFETI